MGRNQRWTSGLGVVLAAMLMAVPMAEADTLTPGVWEGAVEDRGAVIAARLSLAKLELGDQSSVMRWFSPRDCSMFLEYAGKRAGAYEMRIVSSDGGWCDLYRGGVLDLTAGAAASLNFSLTNKSGGRALKGELSPPE